MDANLAARRQTLTARTPRSRPSPLHQVDTAVSLLQSIWADRIAPSAPVAYAKSALALTPAAVTSLLPDFPLTDEDRGKAYIEMSGRRGLGVRADDLIDALLSRAGDEVRRRNEGMSDDEVAETARQIGVGALRYYMMRFARNTVVAFDLDAALAFDLAEPELAALDALHTPMQTAVLV